MHQSVDRYSPDPDSQATSYDGHKITVLNLPWFLQWRSICITEVAAGYVLYIKVLLVISQNSQKSSCVRVSFLIKLAASGLNFIKKILWHRCFPVNFAKSIRILFLQNTSGWLLLALDVKKVDRKKIKREIFVLKIY